VTHIQFETPNDYPFRNSGFKMTIGQFMSERVAGSKENWHEGYTGVSRTSMIYLAAASLARLYKDKVTKKVQQPQQV